MEKEEIVALIKEAVEKNQIETLSEVEKMLTSFEDKVKQGLSDALNALKNKGVAGNVDEIIEKKLNEFRLEIKGIPAKPRLKPDLKYNEDGKLHGKKDRVIMMPTDEWALHGIANPHIATHEAEKEFECSGEQADHFGKKGFATFVKVAKVHAKVESLNKTALKLN